MLKKQAKNTIHGTKVQYYRTLHFSGALKKWNE